MECLQCKNDFDGRRFGFYRLVKTPSKGLDWNNFSYLHPCSPWKPRLALYVEFVFVEISGIAGDSLDLGKILRFMWKQILSSSR